MGYGVFKEKLSKESFYLNAAYEDQLKVLETFIEEDRMKVFYLKNSSSDLPLSEIRAFVFEDIKVIEISFVDDAVQFLVRYYRDINKVLLEYKEFDYARLTVEFSDDTIYLDSKIDFNSSQQNKARIKIEEIYKLIV